MDMERRELLTWLGVGGGIGIGAIVGLSAFAGAPPDNTDSRTDSTPKPPREPSVRHEEAFGTVIDAVAAGADPGGGEPINSFIEEYADDDTLLSFPEGTYRFRPIDLSGFRDLGISASGEVPPTFIAETGTCIEGGRSYARFDGVEGFLLDNIEFDFDGESIGGAIRINATGDATISNISATGGCSDQAARFRVDVLDPEATASVENLRIDNQREDISLTGIFVGKQHAGEVVFRDCNVQAFTDNGLYASAPGLEDGQGGIVRIEGGTYRNNNIANVRLGSEGSTARGVESISDAPPPTTADSPDTNARGFRLRSGQGQLIEDCVARITQDSQHTHGGIVFHRTNGGATVRNTRVEVDRNDTPAVRLFPRDDDHTGTPVFDGLEVTGTASIGRTVLVDGRDETVFRDCTIEQSGLGRDGIHLWDSADCRIVDSRIDVTNNALVLRGSNVTIENTTIVTLDGIEEIDEMEATDEEFPPRGQQ